VRRKAISYFKVGAERRTMGRTGILIYLSLDEHRAEIVADEAIASHVGPEVWGEAMVALIDHVREGRPGKGMAEAVRQVGAVLAEHFPKSESNPNELPDRLIEL
jgi:putative membrane protein